MSKQENRFSRRGRPEMGSGFMLRRTVLAGIAAILMGACLGVSGGASAHNIDLSKAREVARDYARPIRDEPGRGYVNFSTRCKTAFPGHNHIVKCTIEYQNAKDKAAGVYTCKETIEVYLWHHGRSNTHNYTYNIRHTSGNKCGSQQPGVTYV